MIEALAEVAASLPEVEENQKTQGSLETAEHERLDDNGHEYRDENGNYVPNNSYEKDGVVYETDDLGNIYCADGKYFPNDVFILDDIAYETDENGELVSEEAEFSEEREPNAEQIPEVESDPLSDMGEPEWEKTDDSGNSLWGYSNDDGTIDWYNSNGVYEATSSASNDGEHSGVDTTADETKDDGEQKYPPNSEVRIDGERYRTDDNGNPHAKYNEEEKRWELLPNNEYTINGYTYRTNEKGQIVNVTGQLHEKKHEGRKKINDDVSNMRDTDERGHLIADWFDGSNHMDNLVPMDMELNHGAYNEMEKELNEAIKAGKDVHVDIDVEYDESGRPTKFTVTVTIDGETEVHVFSNEPTNGGTSNG